MRLSNKCRQFGVLLVLLPRIGVTSTDIGMFCLATLRNTTEDNAGELFHLWIVSRQRTDRHGKYWTARQAFPNALCDLRMVDDNPDVCREFIAAGQTATDIRLPKRQELPGHRSYASILGSRRAPGCLDRGPGLSSSSITIRNLLVVRLLTRHDHCWCYWLITGYWFINLSEARKSNLQSPWACSAALAPLVPYHCPSLIRILPPVQLWIFRIGPQWLFQVVLVHWSQVVLTLHQVVQRGSWT